MGIINSWCFYHFLPEAEKVTSFLGTFFFSVFALPPLHFNPFSSYLLPLLSDLCSVALSLGLAMSLRVLQKEKGQKIGLLSLATLLGCVLND